MIINRLVLPSFLGLALVMIILNIASLGTLGTGIHLSAPNWNAIFLKACPFINLAAYLIFAPGLAIYDQVFGFYYLMRIY